MPLIRRVVFGEPKPGGAGLASALAGVEGSSYCNRGGALQHDRVTDVPFSIPLLKLDLAHVTPLKFVCGRPESADSWGLFAWHHMPLYYAGAQSAGLDPVELEAARLCKAIYADEEPWDERKDTAGVSWGMRRVNGRAYVVFRGSYTLFDWLEDATALDPSRLFLHDALGSLWGGFFLGIPETWKLVKPLVSTANEIVFAGHSLGAARATIVAALAKLDLEKR